jgi:hypothetical protein
MTHILPSAFLRRVLVLDALASGATGLMMAAGAQVLAGLCGLPASLLTYSGLSLLPFAAIVGLLARRDTLPAAIVWAVIAYNGLWSIDSVVLLASGWIAPSALGYAFVLGQALVVMVIAECEYLGLRRSRSTAHALVA